MLTIILANTIVALFVLLMGKGAHTGRVEMSMYVPAFLVLARTHSLLSWPLVNFAVLAIGEALSHDSAEQGAHARKCPGGESGESP